MALSPPEKGTPKARFAALLREHMRLGTRPAGKRGTGAWSVQDFAVAIGIGARTVQNYSSGATLPPTLDGILNALFADDPRHATARATLLGAFNAARGVAAPAGAVALSNIPIRIPTHFMGREEPLALIHAALSRYEGRVAITALHGLRGVGKTVLAAAYAEQQRAAYRATWWLRAQTEPTLRADLVGLGVRLGWVAADEKEEPALATVMDRLRQEGEGILLIYDNAIEARGLAPFLPRGGAARVIITSNAHAWRGVAEPVEIRLWPKAIGADYLIARTGRAAERAAAEALSEALGGLPLAHEQAAAFCERLDIALADYGRRFAAAPARLLDDDRHAPAEYHDGLTVAKTFALAIEQAAALHPAAAPLIAHSALLPAEPIPLFLFEEGRAELGEPLATLLVEDGLEEAIAALRAFALLDREAIADERDPAVVTETIRLHRLVRAVATPGEAATADVMRRGLLAALADVRPGDLFNTPASWPRARRLDALALGLTGEEGAAGLAAEATASLLDGLGIYRHRVLAAYAAARPLFVRALAIRETALGPDHPDTARSLNNLAVLLQTQGDLAGARPLHDRALAIREKELGPDHPDTAASLNNLALLLQAQGDLSGAQPLFTRALAIFEKAPGPDHPDTAGSLNGLASVLQTQGDLAGARPLHDRALAIFEKALGPDHPHTGMSLTNLGVLLYAQGDLAEARPLLERALAIWEKKVGPDHPHTAICLSNLGVLLYAQGDLAEARPLLERALAILEKKIGPKHPNTNQVRFGFARLLLADGDLAEAAAYGEAALAAHEAALGPAHAWTLDSARVTAEAWDRLGRTEEAAALKARLGLA